MPFPVDQEVRVETRDALRELLGPRRPGRVLAVVLMLLLALVVAALVEVPWQQSIHGKGQVTVFDPDSRPQKVDARIPGRLVKWLVVEGQEVKAGQTLCLLEDLDAKFLDADQPLRLREQQEALLRKRRAAELRLDVLARQLEAVQASRDAAIPAAGGKRQQSVERLEMAEQSVVLSRQNLETASLNRERVQRLHDAGLRSTRELELAELGVTAARTELERALAARDVAGREVEIAGFDALKVASDMDASLQKIADESLKVEESLASVDSDLRKLAVEQANVRIRVEQRKVVAPVDGRLVRIESLGPGETVKAGDPLAVLVPHTRDQAVELYISDFDAPLVSEGRDVRLMFSGFPAVPFTAWPWAAVGTFGGRIVAVDAVDDGAGKYRVLVRPDGVPAWPPPDRLRPGTQVTGWVMLDTVPLYWELWRQLNAFPPVPITSEKIKTKPAIQR